MAFFFGGSSSAADTQKQNIFGGPAAAGDEQAAAPQKTDVFQTSSMDGGTVTGRSSASQDAGGVSAAPAQSAGYNPKGIQSAYARIGQGIKLPTQSISNAQSSIQEGQQKLQDEATKYAAAGQQQAKGFTLDDDTLEKTASGDRDAYQKTAERLTASAPQVQAFKGLGDQLPNVQNIRDNTKAYAPEAGPNYTAGQSRFDAALLKRNPEYIRIQQQLLGEESALRKQNYDMQDTETEKQKTMLDESYKTSTGDIKKRLGGLSGKVVEGLKAKETAEDARRAGLDTNTIAKSEYTKLKSKIAEDLKTADPRSQQYRAAAYMDQLSPEQLISQFVNVDRDTDWREFVDEGSADRYNRIEGLLGNSNMLTPNLQGAGKDYVFDEGNAYKSILSEITGRRARADETSKSRLEQLRQQAQARAQGYSQQDNTRNARDAAMKELAAYGRSKYGAQGGQFGDLAQLHAQDLFQNEANWNKLMEQGLVRENGLTDWTQALTAEEAAQMNALTQDIGGIETYQGGVYKPEYDMQALQQYYDQYVAPYMQQYQNQHAPAPAPKSSAGSNNRKRNMEK